MFLKKLLQNLCKSFKQNERTYTQDFFKNLKKEEYPRYVKKIFKQRTGRTLNLKNPKTFSEKIQWLKLYDNLPIKATLSDKLLVRDWVATKTDKLAFTKLYGVWNSYDEINFSTLPNTFAIKTNHGSRMNMFIIDKSKYNERSRIHTKKTFDDWMKVNFAFSYGFELQYKDIKPKIYIEELLFTSEGRAHDEYMVMCMNGKAKFVEQLIYPKGTGAKRATHDLNWKKINVTHSMNPICEEEIKKPDNLATMVEIAELLAKDFKLVRVDFFDVDGTLYFGEMTFTPCSGHMTFEPQKYDMIFGDMLDLEIKNNPKIIY